MAISRALRRLLNVLELEEEQARLALESATAELGRLERARGAAIERERQGRRLVARSATTGEVTDRLAGLEEQRIARRSGTILDLRVREAEPIAHERRHAFLLKRVQRRQAATLIEEAEARQALEDSRRAQQALDEAFLNSMRRKAGGSDEHGQRESGSQQQASESDPGLGFGKETLSEKT